MRNAGPKAISTLAALAVVLAATTGRAERRSKVARRVQVIDLLEVRDEGIRTVVTIRSSARPAFTAFKAASPRRLVVDVSEARLRGVPSAIDTETAAIAGIGASEIRSGSVPVSRFLINLKEGTTYRVERAPRSVVVTLTGPDPRDDEEAQRRIQAVERRAEAEEDARIRAEQRARVAMATARQEAEARAAAEARLAEAQGAIEAAKAAKVAAEGIAREAREMRARAERAATAAASRAEAEARARAVAQKAAAQAEAAQRAAREAAAAQARAEREAAAALVRAERQERARAERSDEDGRAARQARAIREARAEALRQARLAASAASDAAEARRSAKNATREATEARLAAERLRRSAERRAAEAEAASADANRRVAAAEEARRAAENEVEASSRARRAAEARSSQAIAERRRAEEQARVARARAAAETRARADAERLLTAARADASAAKRALDRITETADAARRRAEQRVADLERSRKAAETRVAEERRARREAERNARAAESKRQRAERDVGEARRAVQEAEAARVAAERASRNVAASRRLAEASRQERAGLEQRIAAERSARVETAAEAAESRNRLRQMEGALSRIRRVVAERERALGTAQRALAERTGASERAERARSEAIGRAREAERLRDEALAKARVAERAQRSADSARLRAQAERAAAERMVGEAEGRVAAADRSRADAERRVREAETRASEAERARVAADREVRLAERRAEEAELARAGAERRVREAEGRATAADRARAEAEQRAARAIAAADAVRSRAEREVAEARGRGQSEVTAARSEAEREVAAARLRADREVTAARSEAEREVAAARLEAERRVAAARTDAERGVASSRTQTVVAASSAIAPNPYATVSTTTTTTAPPRPASTTSGGETPRGATPPVAEREGTRIRDVRFDQRDGEQLVIVDLTGSANARVRRLGERALLLEMEGVLLPEALERTLDVTAFDGAVHTVSTYRPNGARSAVRVEVELGEQVANELRRDGSRVVWAFRPTSPPQRTARAAPQRRTGTSRPPSRTLARESGDVYGMVSEETASFLTSVPMQARADRGRGRYRGRRIDLDFKDADIHNILRLVAEVGRVNIVTSDDVSGTVTIRMRNVPWDQALDVILQSKGLGMERQGNLIRVAPLTVLEKEREMAIARRKQQVELEPMETRLIPVSYATAGELQPRAQELLSSRGSLSVDERTNVMIARDVAENLNQIEELVRNLDTQTPQVLIEARIVEANSNYLRELGIQWGGDIEFSTATGNPTGLGFPANVGVAGGATDRQTETAGLSPVSQSVANPNFAVNLPAAVGRGSGGAVGITLGSIANNFNLNLRLSALEATGTGRIISEPRILTLDNREAHIEQGTLIPYSQVSAAGVQTAFQEAKLNLTVRPHVTADGSVLMAIKITRDEPDFNRTGARGDPTINKREAETELLIEDGRTAVIGGIYTRNSGLQYNQVPFFANIPVLGWFFRNQRTTDLRGELLIFITPRIVNRAESIGR